VIETCHRSLDASLQRRPSDDRQDKPPGETKWQGVRGNQLRKELDFANDLVIDGITQVVVFGQATGPD
jgi:hypothetical protein